MSAAGRRLLPALVVVTSAGAAVGYEAVVHGHLPPLDVCLALDTPA